MLTFTFQFSTFNFNLCSVCRHVMPTTYFLNPPRQNAPSQPVDYHRPFDLSPFPALSGPKCHRSEKTPPERASLRKLLTFPHRLHSPPLQRKGLGVGSISHGKHGKHRKHSHKERPQLPFPSPRRGGGRGGDIIIIVPLFERI